MEIFMFVLWIALGFAFVMGPAGILIDRMVSGWYALAWIFFSALVVAAIVGYVVDHQPPVQAFTLPKSQWECTSTYQVSHFTGKVWYSSTECATYSRRSR